MTKHRQNQRSVILNYLKKANIRDSEYQEAVKYFTKLKSLKKDYDRVISFEKDNPYIFKIAKYLKNRTFKLDKKNYFKYERNNYQIIRRIDEGLLILSGWIGYKIGDFETEHLIVDRFAYIHDSGNIYHSIFERLKGFGVWQPCRYNRRMGSGDYDRFYNCKIAHHDKETMNILKSLDKFKYLDLDKIKHINPYEMLMARTDENIYQIELLQKAGMYKLASTYAFDRYTSNNINLENLKKHNKDFKDISYNQLLDRIHEEERARRRKEMEDRARIPELEKTYYEDNYREYIVGGFILKTPASKEDLKKEGETLKHCVERYHEDIVLGKTNIYFLRTTDKPDDPFYTVEIVNGELTQVRTTNNNTNQEITEKVKEIAAKLNLTEGGNYSVNEY